MSENYLNYEDHILSSLVHIEELLEEILEELKTKRKTPLFHRRDSNGEEEG